MRSVPLCYFDPQVLRARADGRFGLEDCWQHPQMWVDKYSWAPAIMQKPSTADMAEHPFRALWWTPKTADYIIMQGSVFADFGKLSQDAVRPLKGVQHIVSERLRNYEEQQGGSAARTMRFFEASLRSTCTRLHDCPMTFRDVVAQVAEYQRIALDILAMIDYMEIFHHRSIDQSLGHARPADRTRIGCFTSNLEVVERLFLAGLPVWLIRHDYSIPPTIKIQIITVYTPPSQDIVVADWQDSNGQNRPFRLLHFGTSGPDRHQASRQLGRAFADNPELEICTIDSSTDEAPAASVPSMPSSRPSPCGFSTVTLYLFCLTQPHRSADHGSRKTKEEQTSPSEECSC